MGMFDFSTFQQPEVRVFWSQGLFVWLLIHYAAPRPLLTSAKGIIAKAGALAFVHYLTYGDSIWTIAVFVTSSFLSLATTPPKSERVSRADNVLRLATEWACNLVYFFGLPALIASKAMVPNEPLVVLPGSADTIADGFFALAGFCFILGGGSRVVIAVLGQKPPSSSDEASEQPKLIHRFPTREIGLTHSMSQETQESSNRAGWKIGTLERVMVYAFVLGGQYGALGLLVAAKGIVRSKSMENNPEFAEYVLVGTLASMSVAFGCASLVKFL